MKVKDDRITLVRAGLPSSFLSEKSTRQARFRPKDAREIHSRSDLRWIFDLEEYRTMSKRYSVRLSDLRYIYVSHVADPFDRAMDSFVDDEAMPFRGHVRSLALR